MAIFEITKNGIWSKIFFLNLTYLISRVFWSGLFKFSVMQFFEKYLIHIQTCHFSSMTFSTIFSRPSAVLSSSTSDFNCTVPYWGKTNASVTDQDRRGAEGEEFQKPMLKTFVDSEQDPRYMDVSIDAEYEVNSYRHRHSHRPAGRLTGRQSQPNKIVNGNSKGKGKSHDKGKPFRI